MGFADIYWNGTQELASRNFTCGGCDKAVASNIGWQSKYEQGRITHLVIYICHFCVTPNFFDDARGRQVPSPAWGESVESLPQDVKSLYDETRNCLKVNAYTASVLTARKILMHVAVSKGAKENLSFGQYVAFLEKNCLPPTGNEWVRHIKEKGNEGNHEITVSTKEDAREIITFLGMLLTLLYDYPARMKAKKGSVKAKA